MFDVRSPRKFLAFLAVGAIASESPVPAFAQDIVPGFASVPWGADHWAILGEYGAPDETHDGTEGQTDYTYYDQRIDGAWPAAMTFYVGGSTGLFRGLYTFAGDSTETDRVYREWVASVQKEYPSLTSIRCPTPLHERWGLDPTLCDGLVEQVPFSGSLLSAHAWSDDTSNIVAAWLSGTEGSSGAVSHTVALLYEYYRADDLADREPEQIALYFGWPDGMSAHVEANHTKIRSSPDGVDSTRVAFSYDLVVRESGPGILIESKNFEIGGMAPGQGIEGLSGIIGLLSPDYMVSKEGELQSVVGLDQLVEELRSLLSADWLEVPESEAAQLRSFMDQVFSQDVAMAQLAFHWNALVGNWSGGSLELGAAYGYEAVQPVPLLGDVAVLYRYELGIEERVPCTATDVRHDCVKLVQRSRPDPAEMKSLLVEFGRKLSEEMSGTMLEPSLRDLDIVFTIDLVAEPATLIPHALNTYQRSDVVVEVDGEEQTMFDLRVREYHYTYPDAAGG